MHIVIRDESLTSKRRFGQNHRNPRDRYRARRYRNRSKSSFDQSIGSWNKSRDRKNCRHSQNRRDSYPRLVRLRVSDIMKFDPAERSVAFFIKRFYHIIEIEGDEAVLQILFMCLKNAVLK